ncbi:MAG: hypothetical protein AAB500_01585 [Patescibacteria group bacterium]
MKLLKWTILWLATWGISQWFWGGNPLQPTLVPGTILIIFLAALVLAFLLFPDERKVWLSRLSSWEIPVILFGIVIFSFLDTGLFTNNILTSAHVLFQQLMIAVLVFMVPAEKFKRTLVRVLLLFGVSHLLLAVFMSWPWALFFTILASATAILFTFLMQRVKYGITLSFLIHLSFYLIFFNLI